MELNKVKKTRSKQFGPDMKITPKKSINRRALGNGKTSQTIKIIHWNVNGIRSVINKKALSQLVRQQKPDFICVNQTKINQEMYDKQRVGVYGYHDYWNFCKCSSGYSGVAVFTIFPPIHIYQDFQSEDLHSQEGRVLTLQYINFYLIVVYIPTAGDKQLKRLPQKMQYWSVFTKHCNSVRIKAEKQGKGVIISGDLNVAFQDKLDIYFPKKPQLGRWMDKQPGCTPEEKKAFKSFLGQGWVDTFRQLHPSQVKYTWWRGDHKNSRAQNIGRRLDYFLVSEGFMGVVKDSKILSDVMGSDHCPISLDVDLSLSWNKQKKLSIIQEKKEDQKRDEVHQFKQQQRVVIDNNNRSLSEENNDNLYSQQNKSEDENIHKQPQKSSTTTQELVK